MGINCQAQTWPKDSRACHWKCILRIILNYLWTDLLAIHWLFLVVCGCFCFLWVLIIPKRLINDSWSIAILFGWFLELSKIDQIWSLRPRIYHKNTSNNTRNYGSILRTYFFISQLLRIPGCPTIGQHHTPIFLGNDVSCTEFWTKTTGMSGRFE